MSNFNAIRYGSLNELLSILDNQEMSNAELRAALENVIDSIQEIDSRLKSITEYLATSTKG